MGGDLTISKWKPCIRTILRDCRDINDTIVGDNLLWYWEPTSLTGHFCLHSGLFPGQLLLALLLGHRFFPFSLFFASLGV